MPRTKEHPLAIALCVAMDNARPVRGKDEVALRSADWHAVEREIRAVLPKPEPEPAEMGDAERVARRLAKQFGLPGA